MLELETPRPSRKVASDTVVSGRRDGISVGYPLKRMIDLVAAGSLLAVLLPIMGAIAALIKFTSPGPILFRQRRLGLNEQSFTILKFRTMRVGADQCGPRYTTAGDPRITPMGGLLRKLSLDELPQLINVVRGEMSLIGPRPYVGFELEEWSTEQRALRARVRPGISGQSQASGRSAMSVEEIIQNDLDYVRNCRLSRDCRVIVQTVFAVLLSRGIN